MYSILLGAMVVNLEVVLNCWNLAAQWETFKPQKKYVFMLVSAISNKPLGITAL